MNLFHTHDDGFRGVHTHELHGSNVEHEHTGSDDVEIVVVFGKRYKQPTEPTDPSIDHVELEVDDVVQVAASDLT